MDDASLCHLASFPNLLILDLSGTDVSDAGLARLTVLPHLRELYLDYTCITGPGLTHLRNIKRLEILGLSCSDVNDEAVKPLTDLGFLKELDLSGTGISGVGLQRLQTALPRTSVYVNTERPRKGSEVQPGRK